MYPVACYKEAPILSDLPVKEFGVKNFDSKFFATCTCFSRWLDFGGGRFSKLCMVYRVLSILQQSAGSSETRWWRPEGSEGLSGRKRYKSTRVFEPETMFKTVVV